MRTLTLVPYPELGGSLLQTFAAEIKGAPALGWILHEIVVARWTRIRFRPKCFECKKRVLLKIETWMKVRRRIRTCPRVHISKSIRRSSPSVDVLMILPTWLSPWTLTICVDSPVVGKKAVVPRDNALISERMKFQSTPCSWRASIFSLGTFCSSHGKITSTEALLNCRVKSITHGFRKKEKIGKYRLLVDRYTCCNPVEVNQAVEVPWKCPSICRRGKYQTKHGKKMWV
jgi:hypothetical protein